MAYTPPWFSRAAQELLFEGDQLLGRVAKCCVCGAGSWGLCSSHTSPNLRNPGSQGDLPKVNQQRLISNSYGKGKLENRLYSTEMHGMLYQNTSLRVINTILSKCLSFWLWRHVSVWHCCDIKFNPWASGLLSKFFKRAQNKNQYRYNLFTFTDRYAISCVSLGAIAACCPTLNFTPGIFVACHVAAWRSTAIVQQTNNQNWNKGKSDLFHYLKTFFLSCKTRSGPKVSTKWVHCSKHHHRLPCGIGQGPPATGASGKTADTTDKQLECVLYQHKIGKTA